jgi:hypothetical protein
MQYAENKQLKDIKESADIREKTERHFWNFIK